MIDQQAAPAATSPEGHEIPVKVFAALTDVAELALKSGDLRTVEVISKRFEEIGLRLFARDGALYVEIVPVPSQNTGDSPP